MDIPLAWVRRALRRSRLRGEALVALERLGEASVRDVALVLAAEEAHVEGALVGSASYRRVDSLLALGLVAEREWRGVSLYALTRRGRVVAEAWRVSRLAAPHST